MATLQERRLGYHSQAGLEPGTSRFSTLRLNHYAHQAEASVPTALGYSSLHDQALAPSDWAAGRRSQ